MFEQAFRSIDDILWKEADCTTELDDTETKTGPDRIDQPRALASRWTALDEKTSGIESLDELERAALGELKRSLLHHALAGAL